MLQRNFRVWSGAAAIALAAVACTDSTTPHGTPARPSFWGGGGTPACFRVEGSGLSIRPPPVTRKQAGVPPPPQKLGRAGGPCGGVESVQATAARAIAAAPDQTRKLRWSIPKPLEESRVAMVPLGPRVQASAVPGWRSGDSAIPSRDGRLWRDRGDAAPIQSRSRGVARAPGGARKKGIGRRRGERRAVRSPRCTSSLIDYPPGLRSRVRAQSG